MQNIVRTSPANEAESSTAVRNEAILSVVYNFKTFPASYSGSRPHSPASTVLSADADNLSYSAESTVGRLTPLVGV